MTSIISHLIKLMQEKFRCFLKIGNSLCYVLFNIGVHGKRAKNWMLEIVSFPPAKKNRSNFFLLLNQQCVFFKTLNHLETLKTDFVMYLSILGPTTF